MRSPVRIARAGPSSRASVGRGSSTRAPSATSDLDLDGRVERAGTRARGGLDAADDARLLEHELRPGSAWPPGTTRLGGQVAVADVLGEREPRRRARSSSAVSSIARAPARRPGRRTTWPASASSSVGKSARKWTPRLSVARERALGDQARRAGAGRARAAARAPRRCGSRPRPPRACARSSGVTRMLRQRSAAAARRRDGSGRERGERRAPAEDEALEQRVRREPVRAVDAGAGALARRVEAGNRGAPVEVGDDPADRVVRRPARRGSAPRAGS